MGLLDRLRNKYPVSPASAQPASRLHREPPPAPTRSVTAKAYNHTEAQRIALLPETDYNDIDLNDVLRKPGGKLKLREIQSQMLAAAADKQGGFFAVGTGYGKAWTALLLGSVLPNCSRAVVFAPAATLDNLHAEHLRIRPHFQMIRDIRIESFERMQRPTPPGEKDFIEQLVLEHGGDPATTILVFDEAHRLKNLHSARGGRAMRTILKYPQLRVFMLSGSMTSKSIKECAHLAWMALRQESPLPAEWGVDGEHLSHSAKNVLNAWAQCLDVDGQPAMSDWADFLPLWLKYYPHRPMSSAVGKERVALARQAFQKRLRTCPGVVVSQASALTDVLLFLRGVDLEMPDDVLDALSVAETDGIDPDGNVIPDEVALWRIQRQLAQGFFYVWDWPTDSDGRPVVDVEWKVARSTWNKYVRTEIKNRGDTGYDSAFLVYSATQRQMLQLASTPLQSAWINFIGRARKDDPAADVQQERKALKVWLDAGGGPDAYAECLAFFEQETLRSPLHLAWLTWSARHKHKPVPPTKAIWLSPYLIDHAVAWAKAQTEPAILWYAYKEVGLALQERGIPAYGAGSSPPMYPAVGHTCALAIQTHSEGKNLQNFRTQRVLEPPTGGTRWEQMLARTHRPKDVEDRQSVECEVYLHTDAFRTALHKARAMADYVQMQTGMSQKLMCAVYENVAVHKVGHDVLTQHDAEMLDAMDADELDSLSEDE